jgi:hypothetical protein
MVLVSSGVRPMVFTSGARAVYRATRRVLPPQWRLVATVNKTAGMSSSQPKPASADARRPRHRGRQLPGRRRHEIPTALLPNLLTVTLGAPAAAPGLIEASRVVWLLRRTGTRPISASLLRLRFARYKITNAPDQSLLSMLPQ